MKKYNAYLILLTIIIGIATGFYFPNRIIIDILVAILRGFGR